ncbi:hypothetical protein CSUI_005275, partial [Cystoisospora suis]
SFVFRIFKRNYASTVSSSLFHTLKFFSFNYVLASVSPLSVSVSKPFFNALLPFALLFFSLP